MDETQAVPAPPDPIAAVTHPAPYAYYARLVAERPFYRDAALGLWVASSAQAATAVLTNPACRVRPPDEPVPAALLGSPAAEIFRHLVRMNDGEAHCPFKRAVEAALDAVDATTAVRESERWAAKLAVTIGPTTAPARLTEFAFAMPAYVVGSLLGVTDAALPEITRLVNPLVRCLFPGGTRAQIEEGKLAAGRLRECFRSQLRGAAPGATGTLLDTLAGQARRFGRADPDVIIANAIGFMTQAYDATAGLIGTTLLTLAREPGVLAQSAATPALLAAIIDEVLRYDPPVQNTRRFLAEPATIEGQELRAGEAVLVVLAAANRDPAANARPDHFDLLRRERRIFTFGVGPHACPGQALATTIARAAVERLLMNGVDPSRLSAHPTYRASTNSRIPLLGWRHAPGRKEKA